MADICTAAR